MGITTDESRLLAALAIVVGYLVFCGWIVWRYRRRRRERRIR